MLHSNPWQEKMPSLKTSTYAVPRAQQLMNALFAMLLILAYLLSQVLPIEAGYENSPLEWIETLILLIGLVTAFFFSRRKHETPIAPLWLASIPLWFIFCARELSWGAAFFPPTGMGVHGPVLIRKSQLPYGEIVNPMLLVLVVASFYIFFKTGMYKKLRDLLRQKRVPLLPLAMAAFAAIIASLSEHHTLIQLGNRNQLLEELMELMCYIGLYLTQIQLYIRSKTNP
jgi:cytochrome bd-type quinol oxidase subunit 2